MNLTAEILQPPRLRFDSSSTYAAGDNPRQGIRRFGPYDTALFPKSELRCGMIYPVSLEQLKETLKNGLQHGEGYFDGFAKWFRVESYRSQKGEPSSIIVHFAKRPGYRELEAIAKALDSLGATIPYALLHLNEHSSFRLFDTSDASFVPEAGLQVELTGHESLLLLDGRVSGRRNRVGVPNVLDVRLDKRSTMAPTEFGRLVRQVFKLARVNWRGFNARSTPVTLNYSKLISRLVIEVGLAKWSPIMAAGKLRDKAWFL